MTARVRRGAPWVALVVVVVGALAAGARSSDPRPSESTRVARLESEIRCPTCESQSVAESRTPAAREISRFIRDRVDAGDSDGEVKHQLVERFGRDIVLRPETRGLGLVAWLLPVFALAAGALALALALRRWRRGSPAAPATDDDRELVARALAQRGAS